MVCKIKDRVYGLLLRVWKVLNTPHCPFGTYFSELTLFKIIPGRGNKRLNGGYTYNRGETDGVKRLDGKAYLCRVYL